MTIKLNTTQFYDKGQTTKYWRKIQCDPQQVELKTWSTNNPLFILIGKIIDSHDIKEIGQETECYIQTYNFWLEPKINDGTYTINNN